MITLRQLQIFVEAVRAGSFRRCADHLNMSQVSVSEHVRALEDRLGTALFERQSGGLPKITRKGEIAHARIIEILAAVDDLIVEMDDNATQKGRPLNISMHSFLMRDLSPTLQDFKAAYPHIDVRMDTDLHQTSELLDRVADRRLDAAYYFSLDEHPGTRLVKYESLAIFVGRDHPLAKKAIVELDELAALPGLQLTQRDPLRGLVDRAFASIGLADRCIGIETDDFGHILGSAQRSMGYACLFEATAQDPSRLLGLEKVALRTPLPPLQVRCMIRKTAFNDTVLQSFCDSVDRRLNEAPPL